MKSKYGHPKHPMKSKYKPSAEKDAEAYDKWEKSGAFRPEIHKATEAGERLVRAISYYIEMRDRLHVLATEANIKTIANRFGVHRDSLSKAIKMLAEVEK